MKKLFKKDQKGFTLAELLIVVAIIAVLVAISIPIFTTQLEKSRDSVTVANLRAAYAEAAVKVLDNTDTTSYEITGVKAMGTKANWEGNVDDELPFILTDDTTTPMAEGAGATYKVTFNFTNPDSVTATAVKE